MQMLTYSVPINELYKCEWFLFLTFPWKLLDEISKYPKK